MAVADVVPGLEQNRFVNIRTHANVQLLFDFFIEYFFLAQYVKH